MSEDKKDKSKDKPAEKPAARPGPDDDVVGKVYDGRLMRRLLRYLRPYQLQTAISAVSILFKGFTDIAGPLLVMSAVDIYLRPDGHPTWLPRHLSPLLSPISFTGITELAALYCAALCISLALDFVQTYLMQWTGQKIMFDLRSEIFRHIQDQDVSFFDRNPVGRLVTRVTSDVDAINEMF